MEYSFILALNGFALGYLLVEYSKTKKKNAELMKKLEDERRRNRKRKTFLGP